ncbi:MAG: hypothetical protein P1U86_18430 [Verrucomicrobiales bacterium]|nr:hypothetical protein [Verrucomicrobiales bacterium]
MAADTYSSDLTEFLKRALGAQCADSDSPLTEEKLREIAENAGLTGEDWDNLCNQLNAHLAKGRNFLKFSNFTDAITELEHASAIAPYRADVLVDCGKAHFGRWKETNSRSSKERAEELFLKALEIDPDNVDAAEHISDLKQPRATSRAAKKKAIIAAGLALALACGIPFWMGNSGASTEPADTVATVSETAKRQIYPPAMLPQDGESSALPFERDLVAHWTFDEAPSEQPLLTRAGSVEQSQGVDGNAVRFFSDRKSGMYTEPSTQFELLDSMTVSAWVKPETRGATGQIVWFGDRRGGRDPWQLTLLGNGQVRFRTDRAVTSKPTFPVRQQEIVVADDGVSHLNQHIAAVSPDMLPLNEWSFVTGRIEKGPGNESVITIFINGEAVNEVRTTESVDYETAGMWLSIGAVHQGDTQNFGGSIDEVRVYRSALSEDEIREIYRHAR